jgi:segregation and condensation protein A
MTLADYRVRLDAFEGPVDLLLYLIRKDEIDIHDIPIARITDQYMKVIRASGLVAAAAGSDAGLDIEAAGEFLVMAATLMEIKSRMIAPLEGEATTSETEQAAATSAVDPRADLVSKLLAYKRYRDAAFVLEDRHKAWASRSPAAGAALADAPPDPAAEAAAQDAPVELEDISIMDLVEAFGRIMATVDFSRVGEHHVKDDETPIALHAADILDRLKRELAPDPDAPADAPPRTVTLQRMFAGRTRSEAVGMFLALLELIRQKQVRIHQDRINAEIVLSIVADGSME